MLRPCQQDAPAQVARATGISTFSSQKPKSPGAGTAPGELAETPLLLRGAQHPQGPPAP